MLDASSLSDIAALPWQLQFVLASGYCAYLLAFVGIRHTHKAADTVFGTLAFGLIAFATLALMPRSVHWLAAGASAFGISLAAAALWRKLIRDWLREKLRELANQRRWFGCRRLHFLLRREGIMINRKKTQRLYQ